MNKFLRLLSKHGSIRIKPEKHTQDFLLWYTIVKLIVLIKGVANGGLQSYRSGDCGGKDEKYDSFHNIEHLGGSIGIDFFHPLPSLQKLKYASGTYKDDEKVNNAFRDRISAGQNIILLVLQIYEAHPELENLSVQQSCCLKPELVNDAVCPEAQIVFLSALYP